MPTRQPTPFFERPSNGTARRGRLLLVSHSFPPIRDVGSIRWHKLARFAHERGWELDVVMRQPSDAELADRAVLDGLPPGTRVYGVALRTPLVEHAQLAAWRLLRAVAPRRRPTPAAPPRDVRTSGPVRLDAPAAPAPAPRGMRRRLRRLLRANAVLLHNARFAPWVRDVVSLARQLAAANRYGAVITSGPPHDVHVAGRRISQRTGVPFVMDMRDPWSVAPRGDDDNESPLWWLLARRRERAAVAQASLVVANTDPAREALARIHPDAASRMITAMNGSDDDPLPTRRRGKKFVIAFAGEIYLDRDPRPLFRAVASVAQRFGLHPSEFGVELMGAVEQCRGVPTMRIAEEEGAGAYVTLRPRGSRQQAMEFLAGADMLVSLPVVTEEARQARDLTVPATIFEYSRFSAWVLALANEESATADLLRETSADVVAPYEVAAIAEVLRRRLVQWGAGIVPEPFDPDGRFSRRVQAGRLFDALERALGLPYGAAPVEPSASYRRSHDDAAPRRSSAQSGAQELTV